MIRCLNCDRIASECDIANHPNAETCTEGFHPIEVGNNPYPQGIIRWAHQKSWCEHNKGTDTITITVSQLRRLLDLAKGSPKADKPVKPAWLKPTEFN
jgi:hypothetical protein